MWDVVCQWILCTVHRTHYLFDQQILHRNVSVSGSHAVHRAHYLFDLQILHRNVSVSGSRAWDLQISFFTQIFIKN